MTFSRRSVFLAAAASLLLASCGSPKEGSEQANASPRTEFTIGWSIYAGWVPWEYAEQAGIVKKWEDKYGIKINVLQVNDYVESINQYTAGKLDGVTATTGDGLTIPAAGGKDTTVLIAGDYSNGNDGLVSKSASTIAQLKGQPINLVELSVSHYLLARALDSAGLRLSDVKTVNTSDADMVAAFSTPDVKTAVTWNPQLSELKGKPGAKLLFDSSRIPGEILDALLVDSATLKANPKLGKALAGIWYETVAMMLRKDEQGKAARALMAKLSGTTPESFESQLATTAMYPTAKDAVAYVTSPEIIAAHERIRSFSFDQGLFGPGATSKDSVGIAFEGKTLGDTKNVKLRFDPSFMRMAADGKL
jgi:NitT/TauT family transport system substrate-binding protein